MAISSEFYNMMRETVTVQPQSAIDKWGKQTWGTGVQYRCRIIGEQKIRRDKEGREITEEGRAIIYGIAAAEVDGRLTLPNGEKPQILYVDQIMDEAGNHHTVIGYG